MISSNVERTLATLRLVAEMQDYYRSKIRIHTIESRLPFVNLEYLDADTSIVYSKSVGTNATRDAERA